MTETFKVACVQNCAERDIEPSIAALRPLGRAGAREPGAWILAGSLLLKEKGADRVVNRSILLDRSGGIVARYDKIHLFDVDLAGGESYRESATVRGGDR